MKPYYYILFFCALLWCRAQSSQTIEGLILVNNQPVADVVVINLSKEKVTTSNGDGVFQMEVSIDDLLTFSAVHLHFWRQSIDQKIINAGGMLVNMTEKTTSLENVEVVKYTQINAYDLGIIQHKIKTMTPAERRLKLAGDFKYYHLLNLLGGSLDIEPIINKITGRTKRLKKELTAEQIVRNIEKLDLIFENTFYTHNLKIPFEYINGFKQFCVANDIESLIEAPNKAPLELELIALSHHFLSYLNEED